MIARSKPCFDLLNKEREPPKALSPTEEEHLIKMFFLYLI